MLDRMVSETGDFLGFSDIRVSTKTAIGTSVWSNTLMIREERGPS